MICFDITTIRIPLTHGDVTVIDFDDADLIHSKWAANYYHYAIRSGKAHEHKVIWMHRVILARIIGRDLRDDEFCDHIDNDPLNNRRSNLRLATSAQNVRNTRAGKNNNSGYKGVHFHKGGKRWRAQITVDYKVISLGYFDTAESAALAYNEAASKYYGEFAKLNVVKQ